MTQLYHISEDPAIKVFQPRYPKQNAMRQAAALVWAVAEEHLYEYFVPAACPRVTYRVGRQTLTEDMERWFTTPAHDHAIVIEKAWFRAVATATVYVYEFDPKGFTPQPGNAGFYVSRKTEIPIRRHVVEDCFSAILNMGTELRVVDALAPVRDAIRASSLDWALY